MSVLERIWYPTNLILNRESSSVQWRDLSGLPFNDPFFHRTVARASERAPIVTVLGDAPREQDQPVNEPVAFIFHVSRCGSTLLCNIFRAMHDTQVVAEAQPVTALLAPFADNNWPYSADEFEQKRNQLLRQMVHRLGRSPVGSRPRYIVKFTSYSAMRMEVLRALWPEVPILFLVRDPAEVIVSNLHREPGWMRLRRRPRQAQSVFGWVEKSTDMSREEFCARAFGQICHSAMIQGGTNLMVIDYQELISGKLQRIFSFLGFGTPDACEQARIQDAMRTYSKNITGKLLFEPDGKAKLNAVTTEICDAASHWATPSLESLLASKTNKY